MGVADKLQFVSPEVEVRLHDLNDSFCSALLCLHLTFTQIPKKVNWENSVPRNSEQWHGLMAVCELFNERPIWAKNSLVEKLHDRGLNVENKMLRRWHLLLPCKLFFC